MRVANTGKDKKHPSTYRSLITPRNYLISRSPSVIRLPSSALRHSFAFVLSIRLPSSALRHPLSRTLHLARAHSHHSSLILLPSPFDVRTLHPWFWRCIFTMSILKRKKTRRRPTLPHRKPVQYHRREGA